MPTEQRQTPTLVCLHGGALAARIAARIPERVINAVILDYLLPACMPGEAGPAWGRAA